MKKTRLAWVPGILYIRTPLATLIFIAVAATLLTTACTGIGRSEGEPAPNFTLNLYRDQGTMRLSDLRGKPVVINFWGSWCPPCRTEMPTLQQAFEQFSNENLVVVGVSVQDSEIDALAVADEVDLTYPIGVDKTGKIVADYGVIGCPTTFFITRNGEILIKWNGAISERRLVEFIHQIV